MTNDLEHYKGTAFKIRRRMAKGTEKLFERYTLKCRLEGYNQALADVENLAINEDTESQLVISRDAFEELRK